MPSIDHLKSVAGAYSAAKEIPLKTLSSRIFNDGKKLDAIVAGETDVTTSRFDLAMQWFSDNWPPNMAWPEDTPRPPATPIPTPVE